MAHRINPNVCISCGVCSDNCPLGIIAEGDACYVIDESQCVDCGSCAAACPMDAIAQA